MTAPKTSSTPGGAGERERVFAYVSVFVRVFVFVYVCVHACVDVCLFMCVSNEGERE